MTLYTHISLHAAENWVHATFGSGRSPPSSHVCIKDYAGLSDRLLSLSNTPGGRKTHRKPMENTASLFHSILPLRIVHIIKAESLSSLIILILTLLERRTAYSPSYPLYSSSDRDLPERLHFSKVLGSWAVILEAVRSLSSIGSLTSSFASHTSHPCLLISVPEGSPPADNAEGAEDRESRCNARETRVNSVFGSLLVSLEAGRRAVLHPRWLSSLSIFLRASQPAMTRHMRTAMYHPTGPTLRGNDWYPRLRRPLVQMLPPLSLDDHDVTLSSDHSCFKFH